MPLLIRGSYFFVQANQKRYEISSNYANYIELGTRNVTPYYLEAKIENNEFRISGKLLGTAGEVLCELRENFIEATTNCTKEMTAHGYRIKDARQNRIFEIRVEDLICHLEGTIYSSSGEIVAQGDETTFIILKGPAIIGKLDRSIGLKID